MYLRIQYAGSSRPMSGYLNILESSNKTLDSIFFKTSFESSRAMLGKHNEWKYNLRSPEDLKVSWSAIDCLPFWGSSFWTTFQLSWAVNSQRFEPLCLQLKHQQLKVLSRQGVSPSLVIEGGNSCPRVVTSNPSTAYSKGNFLIYLL